MMNVNDLKPDNYEMTKPLQQPAEGSQDVAGSSKDGEGAEWFSKALSDQPVVEGKGKGKASEHAETEAGPSSAKSNIDAAAGRQDTVGANALATINQAVADLIPHQKATIDEAHKTLADQRTLLHGIMEKGEPTEQKAPGTSWTSQLLGRAPARPQNDEEAAAPLVTFKEAPLQLRQNALGARAIIDHIDGAQNEFAAASQQALVKAKGQTTNPFLPATSGDRKGAAGDMEAAANQYHVQKSRITASAGKLVGPASTLDIRQNALNTSRAALGVASFAGLSTLGLGITNAIINVHKQS